MVAQPPLRTPLPQLPRLLLALGGVPDHAAADGTATKLFALGHTDSYPQHGRVPARAQRCCCLRRRRCHLCCVSGTPGNTPPFPYSVLHSSCLDAQRLPRASQGETVSCVPMLVLTPARLHVGWCRSSCDDGSGYRRSDLREQQPSSKLICGHVKPYRPRRRFERFLPWWLVEEEERAAAAAAAVAHGRSELRRILSVTSCSRDEYGTLPVRKFSVLVSTGGRQRSPSESYLAEIMPFYQPVKCPP